MGEEHSRLTQSRRSMEGDEKFPTKPLPKVKTSKKA